MFEEAGHGCRDYVADIPVRAGEPSSEFRNVQEMMWVEEGEVRRLWEGRTKLLMFGSEWWEW